jgi:hypothetical protein
MIIEISKTLAASKGKQKQFIGFVKKHALLIRAYILAAKAWSKLRKKPMYVHINMDHAQVMLQKVEMTDCLEELTFPNFFNRELMWIGVCVNELSTSAIMRKITSQIK